MGPDPNAMFKAEIRFKLLEWKTRYIGTDGLKPASVHQKIRATDYKDVEDYETALAFILSEARGPDFRIPAIISSTGFMAGLGTLFLEFTLTGGAITTISILGFFATGEMSQRRYVELAEYRDMQRELSKIKTVIENF